MSENILKSFSPFATFGNQIGYVQKIEIDIFEFALRRIKREFEETDLEIKNSNWRKENGFWVDAKIKRKILMPFGLLTFERTRYKYWDKETKKFRHCFLADSALQIERYSKWSYALKAELIRLVAPGTSKQKDIISHFKFATIHKSTLSRFVKKLDIQDLNDVCEFVDYKVPEDCKNYNRVHISIDDTFVEFKAERKSEEYCIRLIILYLDVLNEPENGTKLKHKRILYEINKTKNKTNFSVKNLAEKLNKTIVHFYGNQEWTIVIEGDGAEWIKNLANKMKAEIVLDKFHLFHNTTKVFLIGRISDECKNAYKILKSFLNESKTEEAIDYLKKCKEGKFKSKKESLEGLISYINKNKKGIEAYQKNWYTGCFTESNIYRFIKSITNGKSLGLKYFLNLMNLRVASTNTLDPLAIWESKIEYDINEMAIDIQEKKLIPVKIAKKVGSPVSNNPRYLEFVGWLKSAIKH